MPVETGEVEFGCVTPCPSWSDRPVFIVGGGPSLKGRDLSMLHERGRVIGVNRAPEFLVCDAAFSLDKRFARRFHAKLLAWAAAGIEVYLAMPIDMPGPAIPTATYLKRVSGDGCTRDPGEIKHGLNSGYGAVQLAALKGARDIYLLGYDMVDPGEGSVHWHSGYEWQGSRGSVRCYPDWARRFHALAAELPPGVQVTNCNPRSAITAFPFGSYEEVGLPCQ